MRDGELIAYTHTIPPPDPLMHLHQALVYNQDVSLTIVYQLSYYHPQELLHFFEKSYRITIVGKVFAKLGRYLFIPEENKILNFPRILRSSNHEKHEN